MKDIMIYGGIAINIIGAIFLMAYAIKYAYAFHLAKNQNVRFDDLKAAWGKKRIIGFGLVILGTVIAVIGCVI